MTDSAKVEALCTYMKRRGLRHRYQERGKETRGMLCIFVDDPLLTARIIRDVCPTCGVAGTLQVPRWSEAAEQEFGPAKPCPTCHGKPAPVRIVTAEATQACGKELWERTRGLRVDELNGVEWEDLSPARRAELADDALAIATALGPFVVADEVLGGEDTEFTLGVVLHREPHRTIATRHGWGDHIYIKRRESEEGV